MNILVTGGLGYIGSHTCVRLLEKGYSVIIADNLDNSKVETLDKIKLITGKEAVFYRADIAAPRSVEKIFKAHKIDAVIHFAGHKAVGESVALPLKYYRNNLLCTINLAQACLDYHVAKFIFSSSATVYGNNQAPFVETMELLPSTNPYGETKAVSERILTDTAKANPEFSAALLRYFNPIGAHKSGLIGEDPNGIPNNLMPYITKVAKGRLPHLNVFGDDYDTIDGTGVRDYIHVSDLAEGHIAAIEKMAGGVNIYNLGTGKGTSVFELVHAFEAVNDIKIPLKIAPRRAGDIAICYADASKAERELGWKTQNDINDMCRDSWRFEKNNPD